jgi:cardiolipin synthase
LLTLLEDAQQHIDLCTYALGADQTGASIVGALVRRASEGVHVRILLDAIGSMHCSRQQIRALKDSGVTVRWFMPVLHNPLRGRSNLRYHRKLAVVDQRHLWSGGRNLASEYFVDEPGRPAWTDLSFDIRGSLAAQAQLLFEQDWRAAGGHRNAVWPEVRPDAQPADGASTQLIPSGPDRADDTIYELLLSAAYQASDRILAVTPYFVPDEALLSAWCIASRRGVRVTLVIPARSNHRLADWARGRALRALAEAGASVHLYPAMIHAKAVVIDDQLALCGTANLDARSLFLNFELMTAFYGPAEISWLAAWMDRQVMRSNAYQARAPSWGRDIIEGVVRAVGFQL